MKDILTVVLILIIAHTAAPPKIHLIFSHPFHVIINRSLMLLCVPSISALKQPSHLWKVPHKQWSLLFCYALGSSRTQGWAPNIPSPSRLKCLSASNLVFRCVRSFCLTAEIIRICENDVIALPPLLSPARVLLLVYWRSMPEKRIPSFLLQLLDFFFSLLFFSDDSVFTPSH